MPASCGSSGSQQVRPHPPPASKITQSGPWPDSSTYTANYAVYGATKAALTHLSASLRTEFGPRDVRVTNIEPGLTDTELGDHIDNPSLGHDGQLGEFFKAIGPLSAEEIADVVAYAASRPRHVNLRQIIVLPTRQS
ncbi:SDR family oxidoreductase [Amycolatopsis mediterranei]|uniref:SDR family oxidoreductase n=1 Tax=Amycolatopsis mediterranei TaxID=33910 RepID=UPI003422E17F